ncbi:serine/threonine-protein kinase [Paenibacillus mucilaginosus]|uniref:serine/threonine protein kinase n=1 Tax=Paenibacillus mucilaginosus TaxID=61624 RepID=UPI003D255728
MLQYFRDVYTSWIDYPLREGRRLGGRYEIVRFLGMGSYGLTYLCRDSREAGAEVVVKMAKPSKKELGRRLLQREHEILKKLQHPRIPAARGTFEERGRLCLVTEYIAGETVEDLIFREERRFTEEVSLLFMRELLEIVAFVHGQGYVHLDVRIPNVMVRGGDIHLIDFGLARRIGDTEGQEPFENDEMRRRRTPEAQSDLYAAGHFLLFLLYSTYRADWNSPEAGWEEELTVSEGTRTLIRRLLQEEPPYTDAVICMAELDRVLGALQRSSP